LPAENYFKWVCTFSVIVSSTLFLLYSFLLAEKIRTELVRNDNVRKDTFLVSRTIAEKSMVVRVSTYGRKDVGETILGKKQVIFSQQKI